jgi:hypothetical protein
MHAAVPGHAYGSMNFFSAVPSENRVRAASAVEIKKQVRDCYLAFAPWIISPRKDFALDPNKRSNAASINSVPREISTPPTGASVPIAPICAGGPVLSNQCRAHSRSVPTPERDTLAQRVKSQLALWTCALTTSMST